MEKKPRTYSNAYLLTVDGTALTRARIGRKMGQDEVVQLMGGGVNKSSLCRWEMGKLQPSPERLWKLVDLFGTNDFVRLNGKAVLTAEEIEVVRKLREG
jgi:transcriptional regulator with XRE-family HTH domain